MHTASGRCLSVVACVFSILTVAWAANPFLPLWEFVPDGEPYVFEDPDNPGRRRVYLYGSHDTRKTTYCGRDLVVWSADTEDLNRWRFDGVVFRSIRDANGNLLEKNGLGDHFFAPEMALTTDKNGKKTYYLYPNSQGKGRRGMVAKSERPDGPFTVCNWDEHDPRKTVGVLREDPAVLVDDDGRVYGYWGAFNATGAELDPSTMATLKPGTEKNGMMVPGVKSPADFRFYEASSIRKVKDKYVFIYSRQTKDGEFGLPRCGYTLAYAYSDAPLGPWKYGGTIIDARGRETGKDGKTRVTAHPTGNTHGSICEINGKWYMFYHRQTGRDPFSRQAMVAPVSVEVEEGVGGKVLISEAEYTSEGFETEGLNPLERHAAGIACHYTGPRPAVSRRTRRTRVDFSGPYTLACRADGYTYKDPYDAFVNRCKVVHVTADSTVGYKYFNFSKTHGRNGLKLEINLIPRGIEAKAEIWVVRPTAAEGGVKVGEFVIGADMPEELTRVVVDVRPLACRNAREALYFVFSSERKDRSLCELEDFRFIAD